MDAQLRRRLMPGSTFLEDPQGRDPVVPADLHVRAPVVILYPAATIVAFLVVDLKSVVEERE